MRRLSLDALDRVVHVVCLMSKRRRYLFVCTNKRSPGTPKGSCATRGSEDLYASLKAEVAARGLAKTEVRVCTSSCTDICWAGPIVMVSPDDYVYGRVTEDDVDEIVSALEKGERVERLVLPPQDFDMDTAGPMLEEHPPA
jgi:(2Fe-2S) ferredoxin